MGNHQCCVSESEAECEKITQLNGQYVMEGTLEALEDAVPADAPKAPEKAAAGTDEHPSAVEFVVSIERPAGATLGMSLDRLDQDSFPIVARVIPECLVDAWNRANPGKAVQVDDSLIKINGESEQLFQKISESEGQLELVFRRPTLLMFSLTKADGLGASLRPGTAAVFLQSIDKCGVFGKSANELDVKPGDCIISVNGKREDGVAMIKALQESDNLEIEVMSY